MQEMIKKKALSIFESTVDLAGRAKKYYTHGHGTVGVVLTLVNSAAIWFSLIPGVSNIFSDDFVAFGLTFGPIYLISMIVVGYVDMRRGLYKSEVLTQMRRNPSTQYQFFFYSQLLWSNAEALRKCLQVIADEDIRQRINERIRELERCGESSNADI